LAGTRERAGARHGTDATAARGPVKPGIRFAPQMIVPCDLPRISFRRASMTAYLISLALAGLVAIVIWEAFA